MTKRRNAVLLLVAVALALNALVGYRVYSKEAAVTGEDEAFARITVMMQVLQMIRQDYVDEEKTAYADLVSNALKGMVKSLDPFSDYMAPDEYTSMVESTEGEFGGLGIIVTIRDGVLTIISPLEDTPGSRAGLLAGDRIVAIEGASTRDMPISEAIRRLKGEPGTSVTMTIHRPATDETQDYTIERAIIPLVSVKDAKVLPDTSIGYIRVTQFSDPTAGEFREALNSLVDQDIDSLIVDLRNNPGGLLESAVDMCSFFLKPRTLVVSIEGRRPSQKKDFHSRKGYRFPDLPVFVLINGGSASAAEIMAGCLRDWKRATLVGERTFGKGSVQNVLPLADGSALRLTTAMYYTPTRRRIHEHGIEPDIDVTMTEAEIRALIEAQDFNTGSNEEPPQDKQLQRAVEALQSYAVYRAGRKQRFGELRDEPGEKGQTAPDAEAGETNTPPQPPGSTPDNEVPRPDEENTP